MFHCYLKENKLTQPKNKQFQTVIVWFIRSSDSFKQIPDIYVTNRFEKKKLMRRIANAQKSPLTATYQKIRRKSDLSIHVFNNIFM